MNFLDQQSFALLEGFKAFSDAIANLRGEGVEAPNDYMEEVLPMPGSHEDLEMKAGLEETPLGEEPLEDYNANSPEDFPGRLFFCPENINAEDPRFASGMEIGIPREVTVHKRLWSY